MLNFKDKVGSFCKILQVWQSWSTAWQSNKLLNSNSLCNCNVRNGQWGKSAEIKSWLFFFFTGSEVPAHNLLVLFTHNTFVWLMLPWLLAPRNFAGSTISLDFLLFLFFWNIAIKDLKKPFKLASFVCCWIERWLVYGWNINCLWLCYTDLYLCKFSQTLAHKWHCCFMLAVLMVLVPPPLCESSFYW